MLELQHQRNIESRDRWERYGPHRRMITRLIGEITTSGGDALILGAGNCNDLDLAWMVQQFEQVHLVDCDRAAIEWGTAHQGLADHPRIRRHGEVDLSAVSESGAGLPSDCPFGSFAAVTSIGLLSQLLERYLQATPVDSPQFLEGIIALRRRHLSTMLNALRPGGRAFLVTEVVSSKTCPELLSADDQQLPAILQRAVMARNFFTGLHPGILATLWQSTPEFAARIESAAQHGPWRWDFGPRVYACFAYHAVRRGEGAAPPMRSR